jgi:hypothetical protein
VTQTEKIPLVSYTRGEEILSALTHGAVLVLSVFIVLRCVLPAAAGRDVLRLVCA